jgi:hypothetical protein
MPKPKFEIDVTNLDKSAEAAFRAHVQGRMSCADWKATAAQIERLRGTEKFRQRHGGALYDAEYPEHAARGAELQTMYENAYPDEPGAL